VHRGCFGIAALFFCASPLQAYSVLTHEAIIDSAWDANIKPLLLKRFPGATPDELTDAHAYAYGGCILQDMGYYPFGSKFFSDLVHYVRSGDFVTNLLNASEDLNEYAFALGALAHYAADTQGHSIAVNVSVPMEYPKLRRKFGDRVTYEDDPTSHMRVEFGFDVLQVARGNYAPKAYHDFIGFKVSKPVLERAFKATYSLEMKDVFKSVDLALGTYRHTVSSIIPDMTHAAWRIKKDDLRKAQPGITRSRFVYNVSRASYRKEWDGEYQKPGIGARILAWIIRVLPKVGPLRALKFKPPTAETERLFEDSFNKTMAEFRGLLAKGDPRQLRLPDRDFDTGKPTQPTEYRMADETFAKLARKLAERDPESVDPEVRRDLLAFFKDLSLPFEGKKDEKEWATTVAALDKLKGAEARSMSGDGAAAPRTGR
jgi:hypothetical protein